MSVLKSKRTTSKAEFVNTAHQIFVETLGFLTRLSARYSRLLAEPTAKLAGEVIDHAEKANSIFPSDLQRVELRKAHLLEARASLMALDVRLTHCYTLMSQNPQGCFTDGKGKSLPPSEAMEKLDREIVRRFEALGIRVNKRKCKIVPLTKPFRFCKVRFTLTESGAVKRNGCRDGMKRSRRKLKFFQREVAAGRRTLAEAAEYMQSQRAYYRSFDDHGRLLRLERLAYAIFGGALCSKSSKTEPLSA